MGLFSNLLYKTLQGSMDLASLSSVKDSNKSEEERLRAVANMESEWMLKEAWNYFEHQHEEVMYTFVNNYCCPLVTEWKEREIEQNIMELALKYDDGKFFFSFHTRHAAIFHFSNRILDWNKEKIYRKFTYEEEQIIYEILVRYINLEVTEELDEKEKDLIQYAKSFKERIYKHLHRF